MFDVIEYVKKNNCMVAISPMQDDRYFLSVGNGDDVAGKLVNEVTLSICNELLAELGQRKAFEYGTKHISKQLRDREAFFKGE